MPVRIPQATELIRVPGTHILEKGQSLIDPDIAIERIGNSKNPKILVFTGLSPSAHIASNKYDQSPGWWEFMVGHGKPVDTDQFEVICVNSLGSCFGSTGPASIDPADGKVYGEAFPVITINDIANLAGKALDRNGIEEIFCVIGPSMGGMTALAWLLNHPDRTRHMINISSALEAEPFAIALRSLQREIAGLEYKNSFQLARKLGLISYRSAEEWRKRFGRESNQAGFTIDSYLDKNARKFCKVFDPICFNRLSRTMDEFSIPEKYDDPVKEFSRTGLQSALLIGVSSDTLFPMHQQRALAGVLRDAGVKVDYQEITSPYGHDSFLVDKKNFTTTIRFYLSGLSREISE